MTPELTCPPFLGIDDSSGLNLSEGGLAVGESKCAFMSVTERRVLLAVYSTFGALALCEVGTLRDAHDLLTDRRARSPT